MKVGGKVVKSVRFAGDKAFVAGTEKGLSATVKSLNDTGDKYDTRLNERYQNQGNKNQLKEQKSLKNCHKRSEARRSRSV